MACNAAIWREPIRDISGASPAGGSVMVGMVLAVGAAPTLVPVVLV